MKTEEVEENFKVVVWEEGEQIDLRDQQILMEMMPVELHVKADGDLDDGPSYAFVLKDKFGKRHVAQISHRMLQSGLDKAKEMLGE